VKISEILDVGYIKKGFCYIPRPI